ncbi:MAG: peptidoglycan-binding domain-containing protein [Pseudomonadota bacterium]
MKKYLCVSVASVAIAMTAHGQAADMPPDADAGECFARVLVPDTIEISTEQVVDREATYELKLVPAAYETVSEQRLLKEASTVYKTVPPVYETVTETIIIEPEREESIVVPAKYETYSERVLIREAYTTWKKGDGLYGRDLENATGETIATATGELLCRVEIPAEYDTVTKTRLVSPETTEVRVIPAVTKTVTKEVVVQPAQVIEETIPAEYETVTRQQLVTEAFQERIEIPATYKSVEKRVVTNVGGLEWRQVLCETNATPQTIRDIQAALTAAGYDVPADGEFGPATLAAMEAYQRANGLPIGYLTMSTVESLGVPQT